ncbi:MAG: type VI secretion system tip protein TssI/VgrG [Thermodesulfobacteriota bacterium]
MLSILSDSKFTFASSALPPNTFEVVEFTGREGLSTCYEFDITLISEKNDLDLEKVLNSRAKFTISRPEGDVPYHGVPASFEQIRSFHEYTFYRCRLVPRLWLLTLSWNNQVFLDQTLPEVLQTILKDGGLASDDFQMSLQAEYKPREYVCQYDETHFDFLSRWMERAGLYYFFQQGSSAELLVVTDSSLAHVNQPLGRRIVYSPPSGLESSHMEEVVHRFVGRKRQVPQSLRLKDYNYRRPSLELESQADVLKEGFGEIYIYGEHYQTPEEGQALARVRSQEYLCHREEYEGDSSVPFVQPGFLFDLEDHFRDDYNRSYLITRVEHDGNQVAYLTAGLRQELGPEEEAPRYANRFTAIPAQVQFRPERLTPKPRINGTLHAHIDASTSGEYAEIDKHGRYRVRLPFDLAGREDGKASRLIRMMQPHGGPDHGLHFPLHKGTEVLLTFIEGDPDRPIIAAAVPNPETASPITSANQTKSAFHTNGGNRLEMEDLEGHKRILLHTPNTDTFLRLGSHNDPGQDDNEDGFAWSTKGNMFFKSLGNYDIKIWGAESSLTLGGTETLVLGIFSKNVIGLESSFLIGGKATFNWPKHRLCLTISKGKFIEKKIKLLGKKIEAAGTEVETVDQKLSTANEKLTALNQKIELVEQEAEAVNDQIRGKQEHIEAIEEKIRALNTRTEAMEAQVGAKDQAVRALNLSLLEAQSQIEALENEVKAANSMVDSYEMAIEMENMMRIGNIFDE